MYRQSSSRNTRPKGPRVKHVLQICLLLAVCVWLIYQVKHSHDKKKEFDESDADALLKVESDELIKLGRKDTQSRSDGTTSKHDEPIEDEETNEEENKHEEEKPETEIDREEDILDVDENETQERFEEDSDHDGDDNSTHEAREEHYKADDAYSTVTPMEGILEKEKKEGNDEETNKGEDRKVLEMEMAKVGNVSNGSSLNNTMTEGYNGNLTSKESAEVKVVNDDDLSLENVTYANQSELRSW